MNRVFAIEQGITLMRTGRVASGLGVDPQTVRAWVDNPTVNYLFSDKARGINVTQREFSEKDYLILNTIRYFRMNDRIEDWDEIGQLVKIRVNSNELIAEVPQDAFINDPRTVTITQAEQSAKAAATLAELQEANKMIQSLSSTIDSLVQEKERLREEGREREQGYIEMIAKLNREIGRLEGELKAIKDRSTATGQSFPPSGLQ